MRELESKVESDAINLIWKHLGIESAKLKILGETGYPDRILWLPGGRPLLIEFKRPGEDPTPKQAHIHDELRRLGYQVEVHDNAIRAFQAAIDAVAASPLSKEGRQILARARRICALLRSGAR